MEATAGEASTSSQEAWRATLVEYYTTNAPAKVGLVTDAMMAKWEGRYDVLFQGMQKKYGPPGHPIAQDPPKARGPPARGGKKLTVGDCYDTFMQMVREQTPAPPGSRPEVSLVESKQAIAANGFETATFTVCARIRPVLDHDQPLGEDKFVCVLPAVAPHENNTHTEAAMVLSPKISFKGTPQLVPSSFTLDYVFSQESEQEIYDIVGAPLVDRASQGRTAVIFAYGQTGSGKTHTMNNIMDRVAVELCAKANHGAVKFSYLEIMGAHLTDPLVNEGEVKMGEVQGGAIELHNLSEHVAADSEQLLELISTAKAKRCVATTEKNDASSRSHGVAIFSVTMPVRVRRTSGSMTRPGWMRRSRSTSASMHSRSASKPAPSPPPRAGQPALMCRSAVPSSRCC
eukprot:TRINITY_DN23763_c0_g1_i1.p1 TRINITY_DN23763_c0_g1~~TRINITY_DN23763_c0_g1_i1.p1  ORF type:complete len:401 (-),score=74.11 TRINITY_DN23763_c0_g1_i1:746-1948(-)